MDLTTVTFSEKINKLKIVLNITPNHQILFYKLSVHYGLIYDLARIVNLVSAMLFHGC